MSNTIMKENDVLQIVTPRLRLRTATRKEMEDLLREQTDPKLIKAYGEMLQGCLDHPDQWEW